MTPSKDIIVELNGDIITLKGGGMHREYYAKNINVAEVMRQFKIDKFHLVKMDRYIDENIFREKVVKLLEL